MRTVAGAIAIFCLSLLLVGMSVGSNALPVKETALRYFTADEIARGKSYMGGRYLLFAARSAVTLAFFLLFTFTAKDHNGATAAKLTTINVCDGGPDCLF